MKTVAVRVRIRECDDGWVRALLGEGDEPSVLLQVPAIPFNASEEVRAAFHQLAVALFTHALQEVDPAFKAEAIQTVPSGVEPGAVH